jgi:hypothetical protein
MMEKGCTMHDYHKILTVILQELIGIQQAGGICLYVCMGEEIRYLKVIPVMSVITGDAKSGNNLCCQFMGKNCKGRVPWLCMTPLGQLDNPMQACRLLDPRTCKHCINAQQMLPFLKRKESCTTWHLQK